MCVCDCVYTYVCVYVPWAGVSLYCPKIQAKGNVNGHTHNPSSHGTPLPPDLDSVPGLGGRSPRPGWGKSPPV